LKFHRFHRRLFTLIPIPGFLKTLQGFNLNNRGCQPTENEKNKHTTLKGLNKVKLKRFMKQSLKNTNPMKKIFSTIFLSTLLISQILLAQTTQKPIYKDPAAPNRIAHKRFVGQNDAGRKMQTNRYLAPENGCQQSGDFEQSNCCTWATQ
jgi:hypothetical protein